MTDPSNLSIPDQIDIACDEFERTWNGATQKSIEEFLTVDLTESHRRQLYRELLLLEFDLRRQAGVTLPDETNLLQRFPDYLEETADVFRNVGTLVISEEVAEDNRNRKVLQGDQEMLKQSIEHETTPRSELQTVQPDATIIGSGAENPTAATTPAVDEALTVLAPPQQPDEIGRLGEYRVLQLLGTGGMGMVFRAEDTRLKRQVALKVMKPTIAANRSAKDRFLREAQFTAAIEHDNIVQIFQVGEDRGVPFIAMPFLKGESLKARQERVGKLSQSDVVKIGIQVAAGLAAAHERQLIHRDIKPDNIWIEEKTGRAKILDFGLVRATSDDAGLTQSGMVMGTPRYMAPEQALGQEVDHRCDLFSLGSVLYHLASGKLPFEGSNVTATLMAVVQQEPKPLEEVVKGIDPELSQIIARLMSKNRERRPKSAAEVAKSLNAVLQRLKQAPNPKAAPPASQAAAEANALPVIVTEQTSVLARGKATARKLTDAAQDAQPSASGNKPPKKPAVRLAAAAAGAFLLLLFGTWIIIKDKDGNEIARFKVPEGGSVEVQDDDGKPQKVTTMTESGAKTTQVVPSPAGSSPFSAGQSTWTFKPIPVGESEWDKLDPRAIPAEERFDWQPKELVGVIGSHSRRHWADHPVSAAISPDGKLAATAVEPLGGNAKHEALIIWDMETQTPKWRISKLDTLFTLRFTADSKRLIGRAMHTGKTTILDLSGSEPVLVAVDDQCDHPASWSSAFTTWFEDGRTLMLLTKNPDLKLNLYRTDWEQKTISASVAQTPTIKPFPSPLTTNWCASPQSNKVIYVTTENKMFRATVRDGQFVEPEELNVPVADSDRCHALSPDGNRLAIASFDGTNPPSISIWDLSQKPPKPGNKIVHIGEREQLQFSPDGRWLVASYIWTKLFRVTGTELKEVGWLDETGAGNPPQVGFTPDGNRAIVVSDQGFVRFWDLSGDKPVELSPWKPDSGFMAFGVMPQLHPLDGSLLLPRYVRNFLEFQTWVAGGPAPNPTSVDEFLVGPGYSHYMPLGRNDALVPAKSDIISGRRRMHFDGTLWIESGEPFGESGHNSSEVSADGKLLITSKRSDPTELVGWDLTGDPPIVKWRLPFDPALTGHLPEVQPFTFSTNGKVLAVKPTYESHGTPDHKLLLINPLAEKPAITTRIPLTPAQAGFYKLALSPDGRFIAHTRDATGDIILDHIADGRPQKMRSYPGGNVYTTWLSFSPDGRYVAYSTAQGIVEVLTVPQLKPVWTWQAPGPVNWLTWTPDGRHLVTHNGNKTLYVLRLNQLAASP